MSDRINRTQLVGAVGPSAAVVVVALLTAPPAAHAQCHGDFNTDGDVNNLDLAIQLANWGACCQGDSNSDGVVDGIDLSDLLSHWGSCAPSWATVVEAMPNATIVTDATLRDAIAATALPWRVRDTATQIEMMLVPPGTFEMGCSASSSSPCVLEENPVHTVTLTQAFYMGRYEVTQAQWVARMGSNPSYYTGYADSPSRPVERVSWNTIQGFLSATGMRLPTEAEWEYAYRAGTTTAYHSMPGYPSGTNTDVQLGVIGWYYYNSSSQPHAVGTRAGNGFGLHDMSGNVFEWVNDWFGTYASGAQTNPTGPAGGPYRGIRGGGWGHLYDLCRASSRSYYLPANSSSWLGFRVAKNP